LTIVASNAVLLKIAADTVPPVCNISKLERGVTTPTIGTLLRLARALECRVGDLVEVFDRRPRHGPKSRKS
jgi:DNA-binding Xre family transcriptional regulator